MKAVAVVPVKSLVQAKSRLAGVLTPDERVKLTLGMLWHVLDVIAQSGVVSRIGVISPDPDLPPLPAGVTRVEQPEPGLNNGIEQGRDWALSRGAGALLVVFADLPLLSASDITQMLALSAEPNTVVLGPDRHGTGTNIMAAHPPSAARFAFGRDSLPKHVDLHEAAGVHIKIYSSTGTSLDVDTPDDIAFLESFSINRA